jgi:hypothetical protein
MEPEPVRITAGTEDDLRLAGVDAQAVMLPDRTSEGWEGGNARHVSLFAGVRLV